MHETFYKREHVEKVITLGDFLTIIRKAHPTITSNKSFIRTANKYSNTKILSLAKKKSVPKFYKEIAEIFACDHKFSEKI